MTRLRHAVALSAVCGLALAANAHAQGFEGHHHHDGLGILQGVQLTDAQQTQVQQLMHAAWTSSEGDRAAMMQLHQQIEARLLGAGSVSQTDLAPLVQQEEQIRDRLDADRIATALQIRAVLSPAQLAQAATTRARLEQLHEQERALAHPASDSTSAPAASTAANPG